MRAVASCSFALTLLLFVSCANKVTLPIKTSLGDLVKIENTDKVTTNREAIGPPSGEAIYVLSFEGKKEIDLNDVAFAEAYKLAQFPLVDEKGKEFAAVFVGSPTKDGSLSDAEIKFNGEATGKDGQYWITKGKLNFPEPRVTLVYVAPKGAPLVLKDGAQRHRIS